MSKDNVPFGLVSVARAPLVATLDADLQNDPADLPSTSTPFAELDAEFQRTIEPRLFGS